MNLNYGETAHSNIQKVKYEKLLDFTIFPNSTNDEIFIDLKKYEGKAVEIVMADINGKIIFTPFRTASFGFECYQKSFLWSCYKN
jgi:hypothetical protein